MEKPHVEQEEGGVKVVSRRGEAVSLHSTPCDVLCCCDLDPDPMTFTYELDLDIVKTCQHIKAFKSLSTNRTDRQRKTDATERITWHTILQH